MNPANSDRVVKAVLALLSAGGYVLKWWLNKKEKNNNGNQQRFSKNSSVCIMEKRNQNEEAQVIYDYPGWKRSSGESKEDLIDRIEDLDNTLDGLND